MKSDSKLGYETAGFEVIVRGSQNPLESRNDANQLYFSLHGLEGELIPNGNHVISCLGVKYGVAHIGTDTMGRHEFSLNFLIEYKTN